jgi:multiple sugar transport system substrate-binding protein
MMLDGEWRVAFLKNEHPELKYGTAPMPVDPAHKSAYGSGYVNGTIIGIPKGADHEEEAWKLVKYLTTNDHAWRSSRTASETCRRRGAHRSRRS